VPGWVAHTAGIAFHCHFLLCLSMGAPFSPRLSYWGITPQDWGPLLPWGGWGGDISAKPTCASCSFLLSLPSLPLACLLPSAPACLPHPKAFYLVHLNGTGMGFLGRALFVAEQAFQSIHTCPLHFQWLGRAARCVQTCLLLPPPLLLLPPPMQDLRHYGQRKDGREHCAVGLRRAFVRPAGVTDAAGESITSPQTISPPGWNMPAGQTDRTAIKRRAPLRTTCLPLTATLPASCMPRTFTHPTPPL